MEFTFENPAHAMTMARGAAIEAYSVLEQALCGLFGKLTGVEPGTAGLIFFRVNNARSRNGILEGLIKKKVDKKYRPFWNPAFKALQKLDTTRNKIVHWAQVSEYNESFTLGQTPPGKVYLTPPNFWWMNENTPDISIEDISVFIGRCSVLGRAVNMFVVTCLETERPTSLPDDARATWVDMFSKPFPDPLPEDHPLYAPPVIRKNQPKSSPD